MSCLCAFEVIIILGLRVGFIGWLEIVDQVNCCCFLLLVASVVLEVCFVQANFTRVTRGKRYPDQCQPTQIPPPVAAEVVKRLVKRLVLTTSADLRGLHIGKIKKQMDTRERKTGEHGAQY